MSGSDVAPAFGSEGNCSRSVERGGGGGGRGSASDGGSGLETSLTFPLRPRSPSLGKVPFRPAPAGAGRTPTGVLLGCPPLPKSLESRGLAGLGDGLRGDYAAT